MSIVVSSLPEYVEQNRLPLIVKSVLSGKTLDIIQTEIGVCQKTALNLLAASITYGDGGSCGWNDAGNVTLSQRYLDPAFLKINMSFCDKVLLKKWASHEVKLSAGKEVLPFEEYFMNVIAQEISESLEKMLWQGDSANAGGLKEFDGFLKNLEAVGAGTIITTDSAGTSAYNRIKGVYNALPARIIDKNDTVIFVSEADYREFIQDLVSANLYHFSPEYKAGEYMLPGTSIRVIATNGLNGSDTGKMDKMVAGRLSNFFYGCSAEDDKDTFDLFYSKDNREFRLAIYFAGATQVAYPNEVVIGKQA